MLDRLTGDLNYQAKALTLRSERQSLLAANIANVDTPNYKARDIDFAAQLAKATGSSPGGAAPAGSAAAGNGAAQAASGQQAASLPLALKTSADAPTLSSFGTSLSTTDANHLALGVGGQTYSTQSLDEKYRIPDQASMDGNTVELDRERAAFADNSVKYEATLRFINGSVRTILSAIRGSEQ